VLVEVLGVGKKFAVVGKIALVLAIARSGLRCDHIPETPQLGDVGMFPNSDLATHSSHGKE